MKSIFIIASLFILASCGQNAPLLEKKIIKTAIVNGSVVAEADAIKTSVVALINTKTNYICTGSLIAPNIVMTAAHCVPKRAADMKVIFDLDVDAVLNSLEPDYKQERLFKVTDFKVGPTWNPNDETTEINTGDIALMKFQGEAPAGYAEALMLPDSFEFKPGVMVTVAGFGVSRVDTEEIDPKKFRDLDIAIENGDVFCDGNKRNCFKIEMDGDGVLRKTEAPISFVHETEIFLNETKAGTCSGDSGGPAFIYQNGQYFLFGVTSRGSQLCNDTGAYTNALTYKQWISDTIKILK
jgi:secreted trypsin-like serine protease